MIITKPKTKFKFWTKDALVEAGGRINLAVGTRTAGKTYNLKKTVLEDFFLNNREFVWTRRTVDETEKAAKNWLGDMDGVLSELIPKDKTGKPAGYVIATTEYILYKVPKCKPVTVGYFVPLSTQHKFKGYDFSNIQRFVFDEFLLFGLYLPNEIRLYNELVTSIERVKEDFEIWMLSNTTSFKNPYFRAFGLKKMKQGINKIDNIMTVEILDEQALEIAKTRENTLSFYLGSKDGGKYNDYAYGSKFAFDDYKFIKLYKGNKKFLFCLKGEVKCGVWELPTGNLYFSEQFNKVGKTYSLMRNDYSGNEIPFSYGLAKKWVVLFAEGKLTFENFTLKEMVKKYLRSLL